MPVARTTRPTGASSIVIGGSASGTSSQLVDGKLCPRDVALPIATAFLQRPFEAGEESTSQSQSNARPSIRSEGSAAKYVLGGRPETAVTVIPFSCSASHVSLVSADCSAAVSPCNRKPARSLIWAIAECSPK